MWVILALLFGLFTKAQAQPTIAVGTTVGNTQPNGIWWQQEYPRTYDKTAPSFTLRYDTPLSNGWSVGGGYTYIGTFHSDAYAVSSDEAYAAKTPWPVSRWIGSQKQDGLFVVARKTMGPWYVEAGPMLTRTSFSMYIPDWIPAKDWDGANLIPDLANQKPLSVGQPKQMRVELVAGVGYQIDKDLSIQFTLYPTTVRGDVETEAGGPGLLKGYSGNIAIGWTFK